MQNPLIVESNLLPTMGAKSRRLVRQVFFCLSHAPFLVKNNVCDATVAGEIYLQLAADFLSFAPQEEFANGLWIRGAEIARDRPAFHFDGKARTESMTIAVEIHLIPECLNFH